MPSAVHRAAAFRHQGGGSLLAALVASLFLFVKASKLDRAEARRIEAEILKNASQEDAVSIAIEDGDIADETTNEQNAYKADDEP